MILGIILFFYFSLIAHDEERHVSSTNLIRQRLGIAKQILVPCFKNYLTNCC